MIERNILKKLFIKNTKEKQCLEENYICPSYINNQNPKYIEIDNMYYSGLMIVNYLRENEDLILKGIIDTDINMNISIFYEKQNKYKTLKELTYNIGNVSADLKDINNNRQDADIAQYTYNDAKYIRKEMQINNQDIYYLYIYIDVFAETIKELEFNLSKVEGILQGSGLQTRRANFRQEQIYKSSLPLMHNDKDLQLATRRNILTNGLVSTYPFISSSIFDEKGVYIGRNIHNNSMIFIDRYNTQKYKNPNMCVFGMSGAGKSFYIKLLILRYGIQEINQYVIDPDREYGNVCKALNGTLIKIGPTSNTYINVFDIREESIEKDEKGYLAIKIDKLKGFFNLIFGEMNEEEKSIIEEKLIKLYESKNINFNDKSLYKVKNKKVVFKESTDMPILQDFYELLGQDKRTKKFHIKLLPFVKGSLNYFNKYTNIKIKNKLIIADIYELGEENIKYGMYIFVDLFWDLIKINRKERKVIYLDEIWRLIGITSNKEVASFIYKIFKTIRKYSGSGVAITQDVSDLFSLDNGIYGKSILNNSNIKVFFCLEEENINILEKYAKLSEKEKIEIKSFSKGECLMFVGNDHILVKIDSSDFEKNIIEKGEIDN